MEFTAKLVLKTQSFHRSSSLVEQEDLLTVSNDLSSLSKTLKTDLDAVNSILTDNDRATNLLCQRCLEVSQEIEQALADVKKHPRGKWKSFRQAIKAVWGAEKLNEMQARLDLSSQQLQQRMHIKTQWSISKVHIDIIHSIDIAAEGSAKSNNATRDDTESLHREAEQQAVQFREEVRKLKSDLEVCIREVVTKSERGNILSQKRLQELTNTNYRLWVAKEVMPVNIMVS